MKPFFFASVLVLSLPHASFAKREDFHPFGACVTEGHRIKLQGCMRNWSDSLFPLKKRFLSCSVDAAGKTTLEMTLTYRSKGTQDSCALITKEISIPNICADAPDRIEILATEANRSATHVVEVKKGPCR